MVSPAKHHFQNEWFGRCPIEYLSERVYSSIVISGIWKSYFPWEPNRFPGLWEMRGNPVPVETGHVTNHSKPEIKWWFSPCGTQLFGIWQSSFPWETNIAADIALGLDVFMVPLGTWSRGTGARKDHQNVETKCPNGTCCRHRTWSQIGRAHV